MESARHDEVVYLPSDCDYGFLIKWNENETPEFYLYDRPSHRITHTTDFSTFFARLRQFPDGVKVAWVEKCQVYFCRGMPAEERQKVTELVKAKRFSLLALAGRYFIVCTCRSGNTRLLKTANYEK